MRVLEGGVRLFQDRRQVLVACAEVAQQQPLGVGLQGNGGRLAGRAVKRFGGFLRFLLLEGGLVVEHVHIADLVDHAFVVGRVGAVGIAARRARVEGEVGVFVEDVAFRVGDVVTFFEVGHLQQGQSFGQPGLVDAPGLDLLFEQEARAADAVFQGDGLHREHLVFEDDLARVLFQAMEHDVEVGHRPRVAKGGGDDLVQPPMAVDMQFVRPLLQVHGEDEAHQPQEMVAVQVADKDVVDAVEVGLQLHELHLGALATVNQEVAVLDLHQLGRRVAAIGGHRATGAENGDLKTQRLQGFDILKIKKTKAGGLWFPVM